MIYLFVMPLIYANHTEAIAIRQHRKLAMLLIHANDFWEIHYTLVLIWRFYGSNKRHQIASSKRERDRRIWRDTVKWLLLCNLRHIFTQENVKNDSEKFAWFRFFWRHSTTFVQSRSHMYVINSWMPLAFCRCVSAYGNWLIESIEEKKKWIT